MKRKKKPLWRPMAEIPPQLFFMTWEGQAIQYPEVERVPGIHYVRYDEDSINPVSLQPAGTIIDTLLLMDETEELIGILNYYPEGTDLERPGDFFIIVDPAHRRRGVASVLLDEARKLWNIDLRAQRYTIDGALLVRGYLRSRRIAIEL